MGPRANLNQSSGKADKYISDEERQYFQDNIQDYLSPEDLLEEGGDADAGAVTGTGAGTWRGHWHWALALARSLALALI